MHVINVGNKDTGLTNVVSGKREHSRHSSYGEDNISNSEGGKDEDLKQRYHVERQPKTNITFFVSGKLNVPSLQSLS